MRNLWFLENPLRVIILQSPPKPVFTYYKTLMANINFSNSLHDTLFPEFIHSVRCTEESYVGDCLKLRDLDPKGIHVSIQNGWHSRFFNYHDDKCGVDRLDELMGGCWSYAKEFAANEFKFDTLRIEEWWVNIGANMSYNNVHSHGRAAVIGIFFVKVPEGSGDLVVQRNDGASYSTIYGNMKNGNQFRITPEENRFYLLPGHLWHWVDMHQGVEDRISISVNYY